MTYIYTLQLLGLSSLSSFSEQPTAYFQAERTKSNKYLL